MRTLVSYLPFWLEKQKVRSFAEHEEGRLLLDLRFELSEFEFQMFMFMFSLCGFLHTFKISTWKTAITLNSCN